MSFLSDDILRRLNHRHVATSGSTNSELMSALAVGKLDPALPHLLTASTQTAGRGQYGRSWQSPKGNVYLSLYHPLKVPLSGLVSLMVGYHLTTMPIISVINNARIKNNLPKVGVKWANDIGFYTPLRVNDIHHYPNAALNKIADKVADKTAAIHNLATDNIAIFNKLAGILIEPVSHAGKLRGLIIGVGMNINTAPTLKANTLESMSYRAIALADLIASLNARLNHPSTRSAGGNLLPLLTMPSLTECYGQIAQALLTAIARYQSLATCQPASGQSTNDFLSDFATADVLLGKHLCVHMPLHMGAHNTTPQTLTGTGAGLNPQGCLQLRQDDATLTPLFTGKVELLFNPD